MLRGAFGGEDLLECAVGMDVLDEREAGIEGLRHEEAADEGVEELVVEGIVDAAAVEGIAE